MGLEEIQDWSTNLHEGNYLSPSVHPLGLYDFISVMLPWNCPKVLLCMFRYQENAHQGRESLPGS